MSEPPITGREAPPELAPNLPLARRFLATHPPPGDLLLCGLTGSHIYGFPSADSDLDLKGIHLAPTHSLLGLRPVPESHDRIVVFEGVECDVTTQEARKALELLLKGNGNMLERILSPIQVVDTPQVAELQALAQGAICRRFVRHYQGFFRGRCREHSKAPKATAKNLLYAYRVALTGIHLLRTGELEADVTVLGPRYGFPLTVELAQFKQQAQEKAAVPAELDQAARADWPSLEQGLRDALAASPLPEDPGSEAACHDWLVRTRKATL